MGSAQHEKGGHPKNAKTRRLKTCRNAPTPSSNERARTSAWTSTAAQATITLKQIAAGLAERHDVPKRHAEALLGDLVAVTTQHLKNGDKVRLTGLGILQVRSLPARMGRNAATGEAIKIKASKKIAFRAAKELKESL